MSTFHPLKSDSQVVGLTVPTAFRGWAHWCNLQGFGGMQVHSVKSAFEGKTDVENACACTVALCEVYARGIMECAIGLAYGAVDSNVDLHILLQIEALFDFDTARVVHENVRESGPTVRAWDTLARELLGAAVGRKLDELEAQGK